MSKVFVVGLVGIAVGSSLSMLLVSVQTPAAEQPCNCQCSCGEQAHPTVAASSVVEDNDIFGFGASSSFSAPASPPVARTLSAAVAPPAFASWHREEPAPPSPPKASSIGNSAAGAPVVTTASFFGNDRADVELAGDGSNWHIPIAKPPPVNVAESEAALTRYYKGRWGGKGEGRARLLCYVNNNQRLVDAKDRPSHMFDLDYWKTLDGDGQLAAYKKHEADCMDAELRVNWKSTVNDRFRPIAVNGKVISVDDIVWGYERIFQSQELFSAVSWLGVSMQQTPNDAFVIADMLWRIRPDLVIELGTSGGGSAHFFAHVMEQYNPKAKVLTMDPSVQGAGSQKSTPLVPWNHGAVKRFCPHCVAANETALWRRGNIRFLRMFPESAEALAIAAGMASEARRVVVIEDSTHEKPVVLTNIKAYGKFVTPGSYMLVQDTRCGRWKPADAVEEFLTLPEGADFSVDPRWEYMVFSQHNGGWLKKAGTLEEI